MSITFLPESYLKFNTFSSFNNTTNFIDVYNNNALKGSFFNFAGNEIFTQNNFIFPNYKLKYLKQNENRYTTLFSNILFENPISFRIDAYKLNDVFYILHLHNVFNINNFPFIASVNNFGLNAYGCVKIDINNNQISFIDVSNFQYKTINTQLFTFLNENFTFTININNTSETTNIFYIHGGVIKNYINFEYNLIFNPLVVFFDNIHTQTIFYDELCVNSDYIFTEMDTYLGSIPIYYPKFLIMHNNNIYKYNKNNNNFITVNASQVDFSYINDNGNSLSDLNYISLQLLLQSFNTSKLILLTNGWVLPFIIHFEIGNNKFIYFRQTSIRTNELIVAEI